MAEFRIARGMHGVIIIRVDHVARGAAAAAIIAGVIVGAG